MPKDESTAGQPELRDLLAVLIEALGQPPLHTRTRVAIMATLDVLGELDLERRFQVRERLRELLASGGDR